LPLHGERMPFQVISHATTTLFVGSRCKLSPNGHWIVYGSDESGTAEIFVTTFGGGQGKWQVSSNGGSRPNWSSNGKEIYYMDAIFNLLAIPVREVGGALEFGAAQTLISNWSAPQVFYDISPDRKRILLDRVSQQLTESVTVLTNFAAELKSSHPAD